MNKHTIGIGTLALVAAAGVANAGAVDYTDLPDGLTNTSVLSDGITVDVSASPRAFKAKTVNGVTGTGVEGGVVDGEIDKVEIISFEFSEPVYVTCLVITHLFTDGEFGDHPAEIAHFISDLGVIELEATNDTSGTWDGVGSLSNISEATESGAGEWKMQSGTGIFPGAVSTLTLSSGNPGHLAKKADYSFVELCFEPVPSPATLPAFALAAGCASRRRRTRG